MAIALSNGACNNTTVNPALTLKTALVNDIDESSEATAQRLLVLVDWLRHTEHEHDQRLFWADELVDRVLAARIQQDGCLRQSPTADELRRALCALVLARQKKSIALLKAEVNAPRGDAFPAELRVRNILPTTAATEKQWLRLDLALSTALN